jgi:hypothetical protein
MAETKTKRLSGNSWLKQSGQRPVSLTLTADEYANLAKLAGVAILSKAEAARRLIRWALAHTATETGEKKILKILSNSLDS